MDVGDVDHSRKTFREMNEVIAQHGRDQLKKFFTTVNPVMGEKPHYGLIADKATDAAHNQSLMECVRFNYWGSPNTVMLDLVPLSAGEGAFDPDHEGSGHSLFNEMCQSQEWVLGTQLFEKVKDPETGEFLEYGDSILVGSGAVQYSAQWRHTSCDGEAAPVARYKHTFLNVNAVFYVRPRSLKFPHIHWEVEVTLGSRGQRSLATRHDYR